MNARFASIAAIVAGAASIALAGCMSSPPSLGMPDASAIGFTPGDGGHAVPPSCDALNEPSHMIDAGSARPGVAFGCATYSNLAAMIARPADLVAPVPYAGADAPLAASAVRRYEEGRATPLNSSSGNSSSTSSSSMSSMSSNGSQ
jgi:type IV pilus biogenesis protein CpaD/CtpE